MVAMNINTTIKTCKDCNTTFMAEPIIFNGKTIFDQSLCDTCIERRTQEAERNREESHLEGRKNAFWAEVPRLYAETDKSRLKANLVAAIDSWAHSPTGLGLVGESGTGKTRTAVEILYKAHMAGHSVCYMKATRLTAHATEQFSNDETMRQQAKDRIRKAYKASVLLIDDIGKGRLPSSSEELLYDILDQRSETGLPVIWTSNANSKQLAEMLSVDRGQPIIRRLIDFSTIISA